MKTLYLRQVPNDVGDRLATLAKREGMSVSAFAVRELSEASRRADNPTLLGDLVDVGIRPGAVVGGLEEDRAAR